MFRAVKFLPLIEVFCWLLDNSVLQVSGRLLTLALVLELILISSTLLKGLCYSSDRSL